MADAAQGERALRSANRLAGAALLALVTAALLPWWALETSYQGVAGELVAPVGLWGPDPEVARPAAVWASLGLLASASALLFVRVAAASWRHEPGRFRRDLLVAAGLAAAALAACWAWPAEFPFWGSRGYLLNGTAEAVQVSGAPGSGWWTAAVGGALCLLSSWLAQEPRKGKAQHQLPVVLVALVG